MKWLFAVWILSLAPPVLAQGLDASVRVETGGWWYQDSQNPQQSAATPVSLAVNGRWNAPQSGVRAVVDGRVGNEEFFVSHRYGVLREGYGEYFSDSWSIKAGQLLLPWGRADAINPTNSLVSQNFNWRTPYEDEQKFGNAGMALKAELAGGSLTTIWLPLMRTSTLPYVPVLADAAIREPIYRGNAGARFDAVGQGVDWSVSYYQGIDVSPSLAADLATPAHPFTFYNGRIRRLGGDFAWNFGSGTLRGELAYTRVNGAGSWTESTLPGEKNNYAKLVLGAEHNLGDAANVNVQFIWQHTFGAVPALAGVRVIELQNLVNEQPVADLYGVSARVVQRFLNDALSFELVGIGYAASQGGALRPRIGYQITDALAVQFGANWYFGGETSMLGVLKPNNALFAEVQYAIDWFR